MIKKTLLMTSIITLTFLIGFSTHQALAASPGDMIGSTSQLLFGTINEGAIVLVSPIDASQVWIGDPTAQGSISGLDFDYTGRLWGTNNIDTVGTTSDLIEIDPNTGALIGVPIRITDGLGADVGIQDLGVQPGTDVLFGTTHGRSPGPFGTNVLVTIDKTTGVSSFVGNLPPANLGAHSIDFALDGTLYDAVPQTSLYTIDPTNADVLTTVAHNGGNIVGLGVGNDGRIFASCFFCGIGHQSIVELLPGGGHIDVDETDPDNITDLTFVPEPSVFLDHFKCYGAEGEAIDTPVDLMDQFVREEVLVDEPELFCNPVDKNNEGIFDDTAHLTGYEIEDESEEVERTVTIINQFGEQILEVGEPELLFVPSLKDNVGMLSDLNLDHFKCYEAEGDAIDRPVGLLDQFGEEPAAVLVGEPEFFCLPVDKNGEGTIDDTAHLTCYEIEDEEFDERNVDISNQLDDQKLEVEEPELLCVPSEKTAVDEAPEDDDDDDD